MSSPGLMTLPAELLHSIIDHLLPHHEHSAVPGCEPSYTYRTYWDYHRERRGNDGSARFSPFAPGNALLKLAHTSSQLRAHVASYCHSYLLSHAALTKYKPLKGKKESDRNHIFELLKWTTTHCVFCGRKSQRRATLMNGLGCCRACDQKEWPDKMTRTAVKTEFLLTDAHLFLFGPKRPLDWPMLRSGRCICVGTETTMFLRAEVVKLAEAIHTNVYEMKKARADRAEARKAKRKARDDERNRTAQIIVLDG